MEKMIQSALFLFGLALIALAVWLRSRRKHQPRPVERQHFGSAFDTSIIAPQIRHVRENYLAQVQSRKHDSFFQQQLLECARETVRSLSFFRRKTGTP